MPRSPRKRCRCKTVHRGSRSSNSSDSCPPEASRLPPRAIIPPMRRSDAYEIAFSFGFVLVFTFAVLALQTVYLQATLLNMVTR